RGAGTPGRAPRGDSAGGRGHRQRTRGPLDPTGVRGVSLMEELARSETDSTLDKDVQARLDQFKAFAARHPLLDQVEQEVLHAIWEPAGFAYLLVYGPSGVGKSTMIHHVVRRLNALEGGTGTRPQIGRAHV